MLKQQPLQESIDDFADRLGAIEQVATPRKIRVVERKLQKLNARFGKLITIIKVVVTFLGLMIGLTGILVFTFEYKLGNYAKFEASRGELNNLLVNQLRQNTAEIVNRLFLDVVSPELKKRIGGLIEQQQSLAKLNITDKDFESTCGIIEALASLILETNKKKAQEMAKEKVDHLLRNYDGDPYIKSRALSIQALIDTTKGQEKNLELAIKLDGTNALAFNCLGIIHTNEAQALIGDRKESDSVDIVANRLATITEFVKRARIEYEACGGLDVSIAGAYRRANNIISADLLTVRAYLDARRLEEIPLRIQYVSLESFFKEARSTLRTYNSLRPDLLVAMLTEAQCLCVEAQYQRLQNREKEANDLVQEAVQKWLDTIDKGFYERFSCDDQWKDFAIDPLNSEILKIVDYATQIKKKMEVLCPKKR